MITEIFKEPIFQIKLNENLDALIEFSNKLKKGRIKSNVGGFQSEDLALNLPELKSLNNEILKHGDNLIREHLAIEKNIYINNLWLNKNYYKDYNEQHVHLNCVLSGVFYIKTNKQSGDLQFFRNNMLDIWVPDHNIKNFNHYNSTSWAFKPEDNYLFLFPAWLNHSVKPNLSQEERISISFNISIKK